MTTSAKYETLWDEADRAFRTGALRVDQAPVDGDPRWGLSLVLLPPTRVADSLTAAAAALGDRYVGAHHVYDASDLHLTLTSLEPHRDEVDRTTIEHYVTAVERARDLLDVRVRLVGLGGSPAGVFAQGFDDGTLGPIRHHMRAAAADLHGGVAPPMAFVRDTAHVSVSVHREAVSEPRAAEYVRRHRHTDFGTMAGAAVALVRYRAAGDWMRVEVLRDIRETTNDEDLTSGRPGVRAASAPGSSRLRR